MGSRKTGKYGKIYMPLSDGILVSEALLVKSASKTIGGTAYANRFWGTSSRSMWNRQQGITVKVEGFSGAPSITPAASGTDNLVDIASTPFFASGVDSADSTAITDLACVRPASAKYNWNLAIMAKATGVMTMVQGTDGDALSDAWGYSGGPPLVATTHLIVGAVQLYSDTDAAITAADITYSLSTGVSIQERSDVPSLSVLPMEGGILLTSALLASHTGPLPRNVYATYYDQYSMLTEISDTEGYSINMTTPTTELAAQNDISAQFDIGISSATGTLKRFHVDEKFWDSVMYRKTGFLRLYPDGTDTDRYFECACVFSGIGLSVDITTGMSDDVSFSVDGNLELRRP